MISHNSGEGSINLSYPRIIAEETSQKSNLHLGEAMKSDDREDYMKAMEKINKIFYHRICLENASKIIASKLSTYNPINMEFQNKKKPIWTYNQTQGPFMCTWWYSTIRG